MLRLVPQGLGDPNMLKAKLALTGLLLLSGCGSNSEPPSDNLPPKMPLEGKPIAVTSATPSDKVRVCKSAIGATFGREPELMKTVKANDEFVRVSYIRYEDNTKWTYDCRINVDKVVWRSVEKETGEGRWRNDALDELIKFEATDTQVGVTITESDGSWRQKIYNI